MPPADQPALRERRVTTAATFEAICTHLRTEHPHDNPEILAVPDGRRSGAVCRVAG